MFYYKTPHKFSGDEVRIGVGIGNLVGSSMTSIRLYENETALRRQAEKARQRATFLAELSTVLSQSLDLQKTLNKVVRLAVTEFTQGCAIYFRNEAGNFNQVAMAHEDAAKEALQNAFIQKYQPAANPDSTIKRVFETQQAVLIPIVAQRHLEIPNADPAMIAMIRDLNPRSILMVPLVARGKSIGVITFTTSDPARAYNEDVFEIQPGDCQPRGLNGRQCAFIFGSAGGRCAYKDRFLAMLGHELRNPLAPALTGVDILSDPAVGPTERAETVQVIRRQVQHMSRIVDDLLDVSRIRTGRMEFKKQTVDLRRIVDDCAVDHRQLFEHQKIRFQHHCPAESLWGNADALRIAQAIGNLLNNAR